MEEKLKTWKDAFSLPLKGSDHLWVYDANGQFVFQFLIEDEYQRKQIIDRINGSKNWIEGLSNLRLNKGYIETDKGKMVILIRGWGYLTGIGGLNLSAKEASNIQDTFAQFIISKLNP